MLPSRSKTGKDHWIRCTGCGHKLGRVVRHPKKDECLIEIKCHSCKTINVCHIEIKEDN